MNKINSCLFKIENACEFVCKQTKPLCRNINVNFYEVKWIKSRNQFHTILCCKLQLESFYIFYSTLKFKSLCAFKCSYWFIQTLSKRTKSQYILCSHKKKLSIFYLYRSYLRLRCKAWTIFTRTALIIDFIPFCFNYTSHWSNCVHNLANSALTFGFVTFEFQSISKNI